MLLALGLGMFSQSFDQWLSSFGLPSFEYPLVLALIPLMILLLGVIAAKKLTRAEEHGRPRRLKKFWFFLSRSLICALLLIAFASPFTLEERIERGDPFVKLIVDNSTSFDLYDRGVADRLQKELEEYFRVERISFGDDHQSSIGDTLVSNVGGGGAILLISDGQNTHGMALADASLYARRVNVSVNSIVLEPKKSDYAIDLIGPSKVTADVEAGFTVRVKGTDVREHSVTVSIDDAVVLKEMITNTAQFTHTFSGGYHQVKATLDEQDAFEENNVFYTTVKVVPRPKILFVSERESQLPVVLQDIYDIRVSNAVENPEEYYAVILSDLPMGSLEGKTSMLGNYVADNNGMVVMGGVNSYDKGGYKGSVFETLLPVSVARAGRQPGDVNVVIVLDISGSTAHKGGVDVEKALAINTLEELGAQNRVGVIAFDTQSYVIGELGYLFETDVNGLKGKIATLVSGGGTLVGAGLKRAVDMLAPASGTKNIILISDGQTQGKDQALTAAGLAAAADIKIYSLGVGEGTNELNMQQFADIGNGIYFKATEANRIELLFGDAKEAPTKDKYSVVILDGHHFITEGLNLNAFIYGFNQVVPKSTAKLLVTTDTGDPLVVAGRYGLGRVVSLATDDGNVFSQSLLEKKNSALMTRMINWAIGDPERKSKSYVDIADTALGEDAIVFVKNEKQPTSETVTFFKVDQDVYSASVPVNSLGFQNLLGAVFAVNYEPEYAGVGYSDELKVIVENTGGTFFKEDQLQDIVQAVKQQSVRSVFKKWYNRWIFVLAGLTLFILDIWIRRLWEGRR